MVQKLHKLILSEAKMLANPLIRALDSEVHRKHILKALGVSSNSNLSDFEQNILDFIQNIKTLWDTIQQIIENPPDTISEIQNSFNNCKELYKKIKSFEDVFNDFSGQTPEIYGEIGEDLLELLFTVYLSNRFPLSYSIGVLLTIIDDPYFLQYSEPLIDNSGAIREPYIIPRVRFNRIGELIKKPFHVLGSEYGKVFDNASSVTSEDGASKFFPRLGLLLDCFGIEYVIGIREEYGVDIDQTVKNIAPTVMSFFWEDLVLDIDFGATLGFSGPNQGDLGLVIIPFGNWSHSQTFKGWDLHFKIGGDIQAVAIKNKQIAWGGTHQKHLLLEFSADKPLVDSYVIGSNNGSGLEIGEIGFSGKIELKNENDKDIIVFSVQSDIRDAHVFLSPGDGDGFLGKVLPANGFKAEFDFGIGFDSNKGVFVTGGVGFEYKKDIRVNILNIITLKSIQWSLHSSDEKLNTFLTVDFDLKLGPVGVVVKGVGVDANFLPSENGGNMGPFDVSFGFKSPNGIGINIDTDAVSGGGYLYINAEEGRYAGVAGLSIKDKIKLSAFGLINTKFPDGRKGYSFLIFISAEFPPIQLGYGFTLNGVGGLVGIHRTIIVEELRKGVKTGAYDNLLFPENPVENAIEIISSLEAIFPVSEGRYVFGIMGKIGWGAPTLITIDLGLIIEVPNPVKLAILGVVKAILPTEDKAILKLQVNFLGVIDFGKKQLSFDATIYDSRLLTFSLAGDMAMRLSWGSNSNFLMSVGGFHPSYQPPPQLISMRRLTLNLLGGDNPRLTLTCYFALTSNTVQFGSKVDLYVKVASKLTAEGYLGFDALFQMDPFYMKILAAAYLAIKWNGDEKMAISLSAVLEGPKPWNVDSVAEIKVLCIKYNVKIQKTWGQSQFASLPAVTVAVKLNAALNDLKNWSSELSSGKQQLVTLRKIDLPNESIMLPEGVLVISQKVLPMNINIQLFGTQEVSDGGQYAIGDISINGNVEVSKTYVKEDFVPAHFRKMSETEKLSGPSFQKYDGGIRVDGMNNLKGSDIKTKEIEYELIISVPDLSEEEEEDPTNPTGPSEISKIKEMAEIHQAMVKGSKAGQSSLSTSKNFAPLAPKSITVLEEEYGVVKIEDLKLIEPGALCASFTEAQDYYLEKVSLDLTQKNKLKIIPKFEIQTA
ncbi:MAG: hypothetical protein IPO62_00320 [Saprospiraceae bacterium]|nr:hypothetical protein [Saprospiraceae bacterium]